MLSAVSSESAPKALGPYSQAIRAGQFLFVSGQVPIDPATGELVVREYRRSNPARVPERRGNSDSRRSVVPAGREDDGVSGGPVRFCRDERGLRDLLHAAAAREIDHPGRTPAQGRAHRSRRDRVPRLTFPRLTAETRRRQAFRFRRDSLRLCVFALRSEDHVRAAERSTSSTPSTPRSSLITFSRCFTSLISTAMLMRPR